MLNLSLNSGHIKMLTCYITIIIPLILMLFIWIHKDRVPCFFSIFRWILLPVITIGISIINHQPILFDGELPFSVLIDATSSKSPVVINRDNDLETMNSLVSRLENYIREYIYIYAPGWNHLPNIFESDFWRNFERQTGYVFTLVGDGVRSNANPGNIPSQCIFFVDRGFNCAIMIKYEMINYIPTSFHVHPGLDNLGTEACIDAWRSQSQILSQISRTKFYTLQANWF